MCKSSARYYRTVAVSPNKTYHISNGGDVGKTVAVLHEATEGFNDRAEIKCAACIKETTVVTITNVPLSVRRGYDTGETLTALFIPGKEDEPDSIDLIKTITGDRIPFNDFIGEATRLEVVAEGRLALHAGLSSTQPTEPIARAA